MKIDLSLDETTDTNGFRSIHGWSEHVGDHKRADRTAPDRVAVPAVGHDEADSNVAHDEIEFYEMLFTEVAEAVRRFLPNRDPENHDPRLV